MKCQCGVCRAVCVVPVQCVQCGVCSLAWEMTTGKRDTYQARGICALLSDMLLSSLCV